MRKLKFSALLALAVLALTACNTQFGLVYDLNISGDGDGKFKVEFPQGSYEMDGKASMTLVLEDSIPFNQKITFKEDVLKRNNKNELRVLDAVNNEIATKFSGHSESGTYDIRIKGLVKEIGTGLTFSIDRRITNKDSLQSKSNDPYEFIQ